MKTKRQILEAKLRRIIKEELLKEEEYFKPSTKSTDLEEFVKEISSLSNFVKKNKFNVNAAQLKSIATYLQVKAKLFKKLSTEQ